MAVIETVNDPKHIASFFFFLKEFVFIQRKKEKSKEEGREGGAFACFNM